MNKQVQAIRTEIERQKKHYLEREEYDFGWDEALNEIASFIDSLPEEQPSKDLKEAAEEYIAPIENDAGLEFINFSGKDIKDAFVAGAQWQKGQMLADAIDGEIVQDVYSRELCCKTIDLRKNEFNFGDKVKVIIVKEEDEK